MKSHRKIINRKYELFAGSLQAIQCGLISLEAEKSTATRLLEKTVAEYKQDMQQNSKKMRKALHGIKNKLSEQPKSCGELFFHDSTSAYKLLLAYSDLSLCDSQTWSRKFTALRICNFSSSNE